MNRMNDQIFDELEDWDEIPGIRNMPHRKAGPGKVRTEKKGKKPLFRPSYLIPFAFNIYGCDFKIKI